jgi:ABC-type Fe3+-hydroxamate transport system substrate-binding protein
MAQFRQHVIHDQIGNRVTMNGPAKRIVSLVPSQTRYLADLGLDEEVVGITKFCVHPQTWLKEKRIVGGTKKLHLNRIHELQPDLIIANKEENIQLDIETLMQHYPVYVSDVANLSDSLSMMRDLGELTDRRGEAERICNEIQERFRDLTPDSTSRKVLYFIWKKPWMVAGRGTFIDAMLSHCGWTNVCEAERYPEWDMSNNQDVDLVLLSSEPFPFKEKHIREVQELFPHAQVAVIDGEMFSWYGSALLEAPAYFAGLIQKVKGV